MGAPNWAPWDKPPYKAIPTEYNGYEFRSRLEARWAVFFDAAGIRYEYEAEGFESPYGSKENPIRYLPDFWFPDFDVHGEVKPCDEKLFEESEKIGLCIDYHATPVSDGLILLGPIPYGERSDGLFAAHDTLEWAKGVGLERYRFKMHAHDPTELVRVDGPIYVVTAEIPDEATVEATLYMEDEYDHCLFPAERGIEWLAYKAARKARFEFGQTPTAEGVRQAVLAQI